MTTELNVPRMVTVKEAAKLLNLPVYFIRRKITEKEIVAIRSRNKFLVNLDRAIDYLNGVSINS